MYVQVHITQVPMLSLMLYLDENMISTLDNYPHFGVTQSVCVDMIEIFHFLYVYLRLRQLIDIFLHFLLAKQTRKTEENLSMDCFSFMASQML